MEGTNQTLSNVSGQIFLNPLTTVNLAKEAVPLTVEPTVALPNNIHVGQAGGSQTMAFVQITDSVTAEGQVQQFYQLVPQTYGVEQQNFVTTQPVQNKDALAPDTVNLAQLGTTMPLTVANNAMTVFESNGQHYLVLPNFTNEENTQILIGQNVVAENISLPQTSHAITLSGNAPAQAPSVTQPIMTSSSQPATQNLPTTTSQTTIPTKMPCPLTQRGRPMKFHNLSSDGLRIETTTTKSQLKMLDIIPSFFQRTVHQQTEVSNTCKFCKFKAKTLQEMEKHLEEHKKDDVIKKKMELWKPRKPPKKKKAQMIRTTPSKAAPAIYPPNCPTCQAPLKSFAQHKKHLKLHQNEKPHKCDNCSESFNKEHNLKLHKSLHKTIDFSSGEDKYRCPACERSFSRLAGLKMHISLHAEEENFICKECGDEFPTEESLTSHVAEHTIDLARHLHNRQNDLPDTAGNGSQKSNEVTLDSTSEYLQRPTATSAGQKRKGKASSAGKGAGPHHCDQCGRYFQKKSQLTRHLLIHTGERPHKCDDCGKAFNQKSALRQHLSLHSGEKKFSCPHCPQSCRQRGNLNIHIKRVHALEESDGKNFACEYCPCVFRKLGSLNAHLTKFHKQLSMTDSQMISVENEKSQSEPQTQEEDLENLLYAVYDNNANSNVSNSQANQPSNTDIVNQAINVCVKNTEANKAMPSLLDELNSTDTLPSDSLLAEIEGTFPAQNQQVDQSTDLFSLLSSGNAPESTQDYNPGMSNQVQGITTMTTTPIVATTGLQVVDGWNFNPSMNKTKNWRTKLRDGLRYHECLFCNKEFRKPSDLQRHIRVHTLERPFKCKQCSKDFTVKSSLNAHIRSHLGLRPYRCHACQKSFTTAGTLRIHSRIHTGAKPFPCSHCDKRFRTSGQRANHVCLHFRSNAPHARAKSQQRKSTVQYPHVKLLPPMIETSTGVFELTRPAPEGPNAAGKRHTCQLCHKQFKRLKTLRLHMKMHAGDKPFKCNQCEKSFVALMYLKAHLKVHEDLNKFVCGVCDRKFSTNGSLKRHAAKHSNERPYYCPYCKKTFKTYDSCSKHIKSHRKDVIALMDPAAQPAPVNTQVNQVPMVNDTGTLPVLNPVEEALGNAFMQNLPPTDTNTEPAAMKQVDPNMVQNVMHLAPMEPSSPQSLVMDVERDPNQEPMLPQPPQGNTTGLEYLTNLTVPEAPNLLLNQVQSQDTMQLFEFNLTTPMDAANAGRPLYVDQLNLIPNMPPPSNTALAPPTTTEAPPAPPVPVKSTERTSKRRGKFHGGKELRCGDQLMYQCMGCETIFTSAEFLDHAKKISSKRLELTFLCEFCCHRFPQATHHQSHLDFHEVDSGVVVYKCEKCGVGFMDNDIREEHRNYCSPLEGTSMTITRKTLNAPSIKEKLPAAAKSRSTFIRLTEDQNKILAQTNPNLHMTMSERVLLSAVAEKDRVIETVTKKRGRFKAPDVDGEKRKYACKECPKSFHKKCDLVRHIRTHTGEKPFKCKTCGKSFSVKSCLTSHEKTHVGAKEFRCHICDLMYSSKASLKVHMRLHTGGMPFKCPHCDERFRTSGHRKCHIASHFSNKSRKNTKRAPPPPSTPQPEQNNVIVSDLTLMLPESVLQGNEPLQLQWNGQNFQVMGGANKFGENITLQIDPTSLQQAISNPTVTAAQDIRSYTRPTDTTPAPNLVIQPITLPEPVMREQGGVQEVNVAVPANLAPFTQMFFQTPPANNNQPSVSQQAMPADPKVVKPTLEQKEVTLVLTPEELATQGLVPGNSMQHFALDLLNSEDIQSDGQTPFT